MIRSRTAASRTPAAPLRGQCRVVKPCCLEVNNVAAISGLRSGAVGGSAGRSGRTRQGVPAAAGFGEEAEAGPLGELGEQVPGLYAEPAREFAAGPVLAGLAGHDAGDLVPSAARAGRAGTGRLVRAAGTRGGTVRRRDPDGDLHPGDRHGLAGTVLVTFLVAFVLCRALVASPFGRALVAIRENERKFETLGRDPARFKVIVFAAAAGVAGLAGALFAPFRGFASPEVMFWVASGQALMMVIVGGIGTLVGPVIGAMVFILVQEILSSYTEHWMILTGAVFVLMVIFLPGGLVGTANRWLERRQA